MVAILVAGWTMVCAHGRYGRADSGPAPRGEGGVIIKVGRVINPSLSTNREEGEGA